MSLIFFFKQTFLILAADFGVMKLGLLLALSVAALVLNLSEGRIVSKCELRQKLQEVLPLPRKYGRYKDQILALGKKNLLMSGRF